ncbi:MAG: hypothetical protein A2504_04315 [Bdellovibrionales bacterium RIFOXYD12_FULL_39_22]|nr:MAG: hypothetical protein A2385_07510 [Bdellovibrionales bacterium RIFOXYB1_FULL_39_21]OFZ42106.1 MAG: hypothetical protein A2485_09480 [Bdellovibrionales bacterium RIFOXYC12_FULL_39_17]OFZ50822.1 MAG: hypothetical protein A2404_06430 [Bdellovibrionales bacterium RIFOXYC1_FULL_39_130]OFZ72485.1 MAG: hypothetical protein A2451_10480 [Bdellovibrionales bacterium RIFOXYC2_FULL_39_8]OFZ78045.1 MAG: hypothetical protein A2560_01600 [Bdellovibrionales bacterium RIFOXYD1_FULL_39_84]OFZ93519.1 MAG:
MNNSSTVLFLLFLKLIVIAPILHNPLWAEEVASVRQITLKNAIETALQNNLELKVEKYKIEQAASDIKRIHGEFYPQMQMTLGVGPINKVVGNSLNSEISYDEWGIIVMGSFDALWPIYTWKRKNDLLNAAENGVIVKEENEKLKRNEIIFKVKEAYYGTLYTYSLKYFIEEVTADVARALADMQKKKAKQEDMYKVEILKSQIESKRAEIEKNHTLASDGLALYMGLSHEEKITTDIDWIETTERELRPLEEYWQMAQANKPEFRKLKAGVAAKKSLAISEKKANWPLFGVLMSADLASTNMREKQDSRFAFDPYNSSNFALGIGIKWSLNFGVSEAISAKYNAEAMELLATERYAQDGVYLLIKKTWLEISEAQKKVEATLSGYRYGKKWLNKVITGVSIGLVDGKEIVDAYGSRALTQKEYYEAIYNLHMAWAKLSQELGVEVDPLLAEATK